MYRNYREKINIFGPHAESFVERLSLFWRFRSIVSNGWPIVLIFTMCVWH